MTAANARAPRPHPDTHTNRSRHASGEPEGSFGGEEGVDPARREAVVDDRPLDGPALRGPAHCAVTMKSLIQNSMLSARKPEAPGAVIGLPHDGCHPGTESK